MSTLQATNLKSKNALPPVVKNSSDVEVGQFCRAWVNFNGTGTIAIRAGFNVSSLIDSGVGIYAVNLNNPLSDSNFALIGSVQGDAGASVNAAFSIQPTTVAGTQQNMTPTQASFRTSNGANAMVDVTSICLAVFR